MNNREESAEFIKVLNNLRNERETKEVKKSDRDDSTESLELCFGIKVNALWMENKEGENTILNIDFIDTKKRVKGVMVFRLEELKNLEPTG